jgi:hypothetical protein
MKPGGYRKTRKTAPRTARRTKSKLAAYSEDVAPGLTWRPLYCPHDAHARCGITGSPQLGHGTMFGAETLSCCARRMSRFERLLRRLGTATGYS